MNKRIVVVELEEWVIRAVEEEAQEDSRGIEELIAGVVTTSMEVSRRMKEAVMASMPAREAISHILGKDIADEQQVQ